MQKKWLNLTFILISIFIIFIIALNIIVDPFMYYRQPKSDYGYLMPQSSDSYYNAGVGKNYDYSSILVGSSMTQSLLVSDFNKVFNTKTVKLSSSSTGFKGIQTILENSLRYKSVDNVFWGIDAYAIVASPDIYYKKIPEYLYDKKVLNDIFYILNIDVLINSLKVLKNQYDKLPNTSQDMAYNWYFDLDDDDKESIAWAESLLSGRVNDKPGYIKPDDYYSKNVLGNLESHILPVIKENPNTDFKLFFVPYSILYWHGLYTSGELSAYIEAQRVMIEELLKYDNVNIYYFSNQEDIICNLYNYVDQSHYLMKINDIIINSMSADIQRLTTDNYVTELALLESLVEKYDIEHLRSELISEK